MQVEVEYEDNQHDTRSMTSLELAETKNLVTFQPGDSDKSVSTFIHLVAGMLVESFIEIPSWAKAAVLVEIHRHLDQDSNYPYSPLLVLTIGRTSIEPSSQG